jgi:hypothetical protein
MSQNQNAKEWSEELAQKLQERFGLAEEEARKKVQAWFESQQTHESEEER